MIPKAGCRWGGRGDGKKRIPKTQRDSTKSGAGNNHPSDVFVRELAGLQAAAVGVGPCSHRHRAAGGR